MRTERLALILISLLWLSVSNAQVSSSSPQQGFISAVDIQARTIQINQNVYALSDSMLVISPNGEVLNQGGLQTGQQIQFTIEDSPDLGPNASPRPPQMVAKIKIINGYSENGIKK